MKDNELSCIAAGVVSIPSVLHSHIVPSEIETLNLHGNQIKSMEGLQLLPSLTSLNLSSNDIADISFLDCLIKVHHINLSANVISDVSGLLDLKENSCLVSLNLSHNNISSGLVDVLYTTDASWHGTLEDLDLKDNMISDLKHLPPLTKLVALKKVQFQTRSKSLANPVCNSHLYYKTLSPLPPALQEIDGLSLIEFSHRSKNQKTSDVGKENMPKFDAGKERIWTYSNLNT
jgi:Leucine-rich repeat (LRR) protein